MLKSILSWVSSDRSAAVTLVPSNVLPLHA